MDSQEILSICLEGWDKQTPLSSYLFLLCAESLSAWLQAGVSCSQGGQPLSPLVFANDSLLFCKAT